MTSSMTRFYLATALTLGVVLTAAAGPREFAEAQRANQLALRQYSWKSRTELKVNGESKQVRLEQVRFDLDGRLQKTVIGGDPSSGEGARSGPPGPAGALKRRVVEKKKAEFKDMLADLAALSESYAHVPQDRMNGFASRAVITPEHGAAGRVVRIQGRDLLTMGDQMTLWVDPVGFGIRRVEIAAFYEGDPVMIGADYRNLGSQLAYQARSIVRYPQKSVEIVVETFDYMLSNSR